MRTWVGELPLLDLAVFGIASDKTLTRVASTERAQDCHDLPGRGWSPPDQLDTNDGLSWTYRNRPDLLDGKLGS